MTQAPGLSYPRTPRTPASAAADGGNGSLPGPFGR
jgi:hypothetical protein